jgi:hypothetical protein
MECAARFYPQLPKPTQRERDLVTDNLQVRMHYIIEMIWWAGLAPWEFELPFPGSLIPPTSEAHASIICARVLWTDNRPCGLRGRRAPTRLECRRPRATPYAARFSPQHPTPTYPSFVPDLYHFYLRSVSGLFPMSFSGVYHVYLRSISGLYQVYILAAYAARFSPQLPTLISQDLFINQF